MVFDHKYWTRFLSIWYTNNIGKVCGEVTLMLDEKRVKHMVKLASYEGSKGAEDIKVSSYFKKDYIVFNTVISLMWVSVGYLSIVGILAIIYMPKILENLTASIAAGIAVEVAGIYIVLLIVYGVISKNYYKKKHANAKKNVKRFLRDMETLEKMYEREDV